MSIDRTKQPVQKRDVKDAKGPKDAMAPVERVQMKKAVQGVDGFDAQSAALSPQAPVQMFSFGGSMGDLGTSVGGGAGQAAGGGGGAVGQAAGGGGGAAQTGGGAGGGGFFGGALGNIGGSIGGAVSGALHNGQDPATVKALQSKLAELGFYKGSVDGLIGPQTLAAVKAFQTSAGLTPDGIVGPKTQAALQSAKPGSSPAPSASGDSQSASTPATPGP